MIFNPATLAAFPARTPFRVNDTKGGQRITGTSLAITETLPPPVPSPGPYSRVGGEGRGGDEPGAHLCT